MGNPERLGRLGRLAGSQRRLARPGRRVATRRPRDGSNDRRVVVARRGRGPRAGWSVGSTRYARAHEPSDHRTARPSRALGRADRSNRRLGAAATTRRVTARAALGTAGGYTGGGRVA